LPTYGFYRIKVITIITKSDTKKVRNVTYIPSLDFRINLVWHFSQIGLELRFIT